MNFQNILQICQRHNACILFGAKLSEFTTFKIGGICDCLVKVNNCELLISVLKACKDEQIPYHILGKGSNVLISDKGIRGVVVVISSDFSSIKMLENGFVTCDAGACLKNLCIAAREQTLTGIEFAYGIPGTVGGALFMNAGAFNGEIKDVVYSCKYLDNDYNLQEITVDKMNLGYRDSLFLQNGYTIVEVTFLLKKGEYNLISERMDNLLQRRRERQPLTFPSAGSTFKRPEGDYAARLIEACGLKGTSCGGAEVSQKHSGFIINKGNASFDDVMQVVEVVKNAVSLQTGVNLECEMLIWDETN